MKVPIKARIAVIFLIALSSVIYSTTTSAGFVKNVQKAVAPTTPPQVTTTADCDQYQRGINSQTSLYDKAQKEYNACTLSGGLYEASTAKCTQKHATEMQTALDTMKYIKQSATDHGCKVRISRY